MPDTKTLLVVVLLWMGMRANAQPKCNVSVYSTQDGFSHGTVTGMMKDHEGFMWFGSWDGINRFDGHRVVSYKSVPGDRSELANDRIDQIVEDSADHLWLKAYDQRIYWFDKHREQFHALARILPKNNKSKHTFRRILGVVSGYVWIESADDGIYCIPGQPGKGNIRVFNTRQENDYRLPHDSINFFYRDVAARIWVGTPSGLCCLARSAAGDFKVVRLPALFTGKNVTLVASDKNGVYFGTADGWLVKYEQQTGRYTERHISGNRLTALLRSAKQDVLYATTKKGELLTIQVKDLQHKVVAFHQPGELRSVFEDRTGCLWLQPDQPGIVRYDPATQASRYLPGKYNSLNYFSNDRFWIFEDNNGLLWIKTKAGSMGYYDTATGTIQYKLDVPGLQDYQFPLLVYKYYFDATGVIWLTTSEGVTRVILQGNHFTQQFLNAKPVLPFENDVRGMLVDKKGRYWLGAKTGRVHVYEKGKPVSGIFTNNASATLAGAVYCFLEDKHGNIWMGTKKAGLYKAVPVDSRALQYRMIHYPVLESRAPGMRCTEVYSLLEDGLGRIWAGCFDGGLWRIQDSGDSITFQAAKTFLRHFPAKGFSKIRHMNLDSAGHLWLGTTDGLLLVDAGTANTPQSRCTTYSKIPGDINSLGSNDIQFVYKDGLSRMWLASSGGGFILANGTQPFKSLHFRNYTTKNGMPNNYVLSCIQDRQGFFWLATENGLSRFNAATETFSNFDVYDGLPKGSFSEASCLMLPDGRMMMGASPGLLLFDPEHVRGQSFSAHIAFTQLQINNQHAEPGETSFSLPVNINYLDKLVLPYNQNIISIDYALLDQRGGNKQVFQYRLKGFDTAWYEQTEQQRITYTRLPPGQYLLEVKNSNNDLYENVPVRQLNITILPPPWKTWWAYCLYGLIAALLFYFTRRIILIVLALRNKIVVEQKLAALKMSFFTNVSHELRTPLTLIMNPLEQLGEKEQLSEDGRYMLGVVRRNAGRLAQFINQLLDLRKLQSGRMELQLSVVEVNTLVRRVCDYFTEAARQKQIRLVIDTEEAEYFIRADMEQMDVVLYNLVSNALKFTPEQKEIRIRVRLLTQQSLLLQVSDQGPGVAKEQLKEIFELYYEGGQSYGKGMKGTGIGLALAKELVELHGGSIRAENRIPEGLTVSIELPVGQLPPMPGDQPAPEREGAPADPTVAATAYPHTMPVDNSALQHAPLLLLVEDNAELRHFLQKQLSEHYRVVVAVDGEDGWQKLTGLLPDVIVSDVMMPRMDGIQLLDKIRNNVETSHIPVVLLSARHAVEHQIEGLQYGADYYITKPFRNDFLLASIENLLRQRRKRFESLAASEDAPAAVPPADLVITSLDDQFLQELIRVVDDKMADAEFNIESMAESMRMSRTAFYKKFKSLTGMAPVEFVRDRRLQFAKDYLGEGRHNISEVAYLVGFSNPKYFSKCFREKYGVLPSDYRKADPDDKN